MKKVSCRVVSGEGQGREHMPVIFDLRPFGDVEAQTAEDGVNFLAHEHQRVARTHREGSGRAGKVDAGEVGLATFCSFLEGVDLLGGERLELVDGDTHGSFLVGGNASEIVHQKAHGAFLRQIFYTESLHLLRSGGFE